MSSFPAPAGIIPIRRQPFFGSPAGFQNVVLPAVALTTGNTIALTTPIGIQWIGVYMDQLVLGAIADADVAGNAVINVDLLGNKPVYRGSVLAHDALSEGDFFQVSYDSLLGDAGGFHLLNWSVMGGILSVADGGTGTDGAIRIITAADPVVVAAADSFIALNKLAPSATAISLPAVASRHAVALKIVDWAGNAGDITITPNGAETIMGLATAVLASGGQGIGTAASITLYPSTDLNGWLV